jgi:hypothetical protein
MPTSIREQLISAIKTTVGGKYGIPAPEDERDLPITIVDDGNDEATDEVYDQTTLLMPIAIGSAAIAASEDRDAMRAQAHALHASIITAMFADEKFGALADGIDYSGGGIQTEIGKYVFAEAQFTVRYRHLRGDPFTIE